MKARDVMTSAVITVAPATPIKEAIALLFRHGISALPVLDDEGRLIGIASESDLLSVGAAPEPRARLIPVDTAEPARTVEEVMAAPVLTAPPDADVEEIARLMLERSVRRIPIVDGGRVVGIVARRDLLRALVREDAEIEREVQAELDHEAALLGAWRARVADGIVTLSGDADEPARRLAALLARSVRGVIGVDRSPPTQHAAGT